MNRLAVTLIWLFAIACAAWAQDGSTPLESSRPTLGGTIPSHIPTPPTFGARAGTEILRHRDFIGKPCLTITGFARPRTIGHNLYDHVITASNGCPQRIAIKVCYYQTQDCIPMEIPGGERKEAILGTMPSITNFGFEFREKF